MLDSLAEADAAILIPDTVKAVSSEGQAVTPDLDGAATTVEVGEAVAETTRVV